MAQVLPPALLAAQDAKVRNPCIELKAGSLDQSIPFIGNPLDEQEINEFGTATLMHSSGRIYTAYTYHVVDGQWYIQLVYTDTERTQFIYADKFETIQASECAIIELFDGNIGLIIASGGTRNPISYIIDTTGHIVQSSTMSAAYQSMYAPAILRRQADYLLMFSKPAATVKPTVSGVYNGASDHGYTLTVRGDGTNAEASFKYGANEEILPMGNGSPVAIEKGMTVTWPDAVYFDGQEFYFTAYRATYSTAKLAMNEIPKDGATVTIGGITYTYRTTFTQLPVNPADPDAPNMVPYEVQIDELSREISMENLNCAINGGDYDGAGAGFRYSTGTAAHPLVTATRGIGTAAIEMTAKAVGVVSYPITVSDNSGLSGLTAVSGGIASSLGEVTSLASCKTMTAVTSDFRAFTSPAEIILSGVVAIRNKRHYDFTRIDTDRVLLAFDCITAGHSDATAVANIFYAMSIDDGHTWDKANAISNYISPQITANTAKMVKKSPTELTLTYGESAGCLLINKDTQGAQANPGGSIFTVDFTRRRAYISSNGIQPSLSNMPNIRAIMEIDIDEWKILRSWTPETYPALPGWVCKDIDYYALAPAWRPSYSDGRYLCMCASGVGSTMVSKLGALMVMDVILNQIKTISLIKFVRRDDSNYVLPQNVTFEGGSIKGEHIPLAVRAIEEHGKLYLLVRDSDNNKYAELAYFDLQEVFDDSVSRFTLHSVCGITVPQGMTKSDLRYNKEDNVWIFNFGTTIKIIDAEAYGTLHEVTPATANLPEAGLFDISYRSGKIYGAADNTSNEAKYNGMQGLCIVDLASMTVNYYKPDCAPADDYSTDIFYSTSPIGDHLVAGVTSVGAPGSLLLFDEEQQTWTIINKSNTSGFTNITESSFALDQSTGALYMAGKVNALNYNMFDTYGVQVINMEGDINRVYYRSVQIADDFVFAEPKLLVKGNAETNLTPLIDPDDGAIYGFWQRKAKGISETFWDKERLPVDLSRYLLRGEELTITKTVDSQPNHLTFSLSNGHLFDTSNTASALASCFAKGKMVTLRIGEVINGAPIYQELADVYVVTQTSMSYQRGNYPVISVTCADRRHLYEQVHVIASEYYTKVAPHQVISALLGEQCNCPAEHIQIDAVDEAGAYINGQVVDQNAMEVLNAIAERYGYFLSVDLGDKIVIRKINLGKKPDHVYAGQTWMVNYTPDDSFSDFTNKITVVGESAEKIAVNMQEELALTDSGTMGWWKRRKTKRLYYAEDEQKMYVNPRLVVVEAASSIGFKLAGQVKEYISSQSTTNTYVDVTIETPNILPVFLSAVAMILLAKSMPPVIVPPDPQTGYGGGTAQSYEAGILESTGTWLALQCLGAVANYQYEIYAQPIGYVRRSFQHSVTDDELIKQLNGTVIEKKIDNPYCYTAAHCKTVADFELSVTKAQRNRIKLTKIMHLKDEVGDIVQINHPYSNMPQRLFVTDITRRITVPLGGDGGQCLDEIEGWKL